MQVLDDTGGFVVCRDGNRIVFINRGTRWTIWMRFVLALVAVILGINGIAQLALSFSGQGILLLGVTFTAAGGLAGAGFVGVHRHAKREKAKSLADYPPLAVADLDHGVLLGPTGQPLARLQDVSFHTVFQMTSSARALEVRWPGGRRVLARGGGMGVQGVDGALVALRAAGLRA